MHEQRRSEAKRTALLDRISQRCAIEFTKENTMKTLLCAIIYFGGLATIVVDLIKLAILSGLVLKRSAIVSTNSQRRIQ